MIAPRRKGAKEQCGKPQPKMNGHERSQRSQKLKNINSCPCALCVPLWQRFCFNCTTFRDRIAEVLVVVCYTPSESLIFTRIFYHRGVRVSPRNHVFRPTTATMQALYLIPRGAPPERPRPHRRKRGQKQRDQIQAQRIFDRRTGELNGSLFGSACFTLMSAFNRRRDTPLFTVCN